jgi:hypothetical protein
VHNTRQVAERGQHTDLELLDGREITIKDLQRVLGCLSHTRTHVPPALYPAHMQTHGNDMRAHAMFGDAEMRGSRAADRTQSPSAGLATGLLALMMMGAAGSESGASMLSEAMSEALSSVETGAGGGGSTAGRE